MSVIQIDKDYVVVGSVRLPRRHTEKQEKETAKVPPEAKGETVDLPMTMLQQLQAQMDALQNQVNAYKSSGILLHLSKRRLIPLHSWAPAL